MRPIPLHTIVSLLEAAQLQLEEATLAHHARIEKIAREQLGMTEPREYAVVKAKP